MSLILPHYQNKFFIYTATDYASFFVPSPGRGSAMRVERNGNWVSCVRLLLLAVSLNAWGADAPAHPAGEAPLLPRELLFGPAKHSAPELSPDGTRLSFLAPTRDGVANIW